MSADSASLFLACVEADCLHVATYYGPTRLDDAEVDGWTRTHKGWACPACAARLFPDEVARVVGGRRNETR